MQRRLAEPTREDAVLLAVGVLCASSAAPLIAATAAPALAVAFWRNALGALVVLPYAGAVGRVELRVATMRVLALAGALLAAHSATFVPSLGYTSVA